ncbi:MAG: hypothetical protein ACLQSR_01425 [Limisphaerales bacterium]
MKLKTTRFARALFVGACTLLVATRVLADDSPREHLSLDLNWKFHLGDDWPGALHLDKAGSATGPAAECRRGGTPVGDGHGANPALHTAPNLAMIC